MDKQTIRILLIIGAVLLLAFLFMSFKKPATTTPPDEEQGYVGELISATPEAGKTTVSYTIDQYTTRKRFLLTYTPPTQGRQSTPAIQTKEINDASYAKFIKDYPAGKADGNVLDQY